MSSFPSQLGFYRDPLYRDVKGVPRRSPFPLSTTGTAGQRFVPVQWTTRVNLILRNSAVAVIAIASERTFRGSLNLEISNLPGPSRTPLNRSSFFDILLFPEDARWSDPFRRERGRWSLRVLGFSLLIEIVDSGDSGISDYHEFGSGIWLDETRNYSVDRSLLCEDIMKFFLLSLFSPRFSTFLQFRYFFFFQLPFSTLSSVLHEKFKLRIPSSLAFSGPWYFLSQPSWFHLL